MVISTRHWARDFRKRFWKLADTNVPIEWLLLAIGGAAALAFVISIIFGEHPGK